MDIKTTTNIDVDFYDKKYILVNAKQLDRGSKFLDEGIDFEGNEYSRWLDEGSRFFSVTCYYQGNLITFNSGEYAAYIRYKKSDGHAVYNYCTIDRFGKIIVALTEQMLAADGICVADLVIVKEGKAKVDSNNGEIINIDDTFVLSTMPIHIDVTETAVNNSEIESTYEFNLLNTQLEKYWADFEEVMKTSKSWAIGHTGIRDGENTNNSEYWAIQSQSWAVGDTDERSDEDTNNSKYWSEQSNDSADKSESYAVGGTGTRENEDVDNAEYYSQMSKSYAMGGTGIVARDGEDTNNAEYYSRLAKSYTMGDFDGSTGTRDDESTENAKVYMENSKTYMEEALSSERDSAISEHNAKVWATGGYLQAREGESVDTNEIVGTEENARQASESATMAQRYTIGGTGTVDGEDEDNAKWYWQQSAILANNANINATAAEISANRAQSYTVGGTGTRDGEDTNNAQWYYNEIKDILNGVNIVFVPKGTIYFSELAALKESAVPGYIYNIKDDFVTDDSFREGSDITYTAGTNVYYVIDENGEYKWDCFGGAASPTAAVEDVKDYLGINEEIEIA